MVGEWKVGGWMDGRTDGRSVCECVQADRQVNVCTRVDGRCMMGDGCMGGR